jgi:hypothetical protein
VVRRTVVLLWVGASLVAGMAHGAPVLNPVESACRNQVIVSAFVLEVRHLDPVRGAARPDGMVPLISDCQGQVVVEDVLRDGDRLSPGTLFPVLVDWILVVFAKITHKLD